MNFRIIRNTQVMTDSDLANALDLLPKSFISFFKRNISVFPQDTYFKLNEDEKQDLVKNYCITHASLFSSSSFSISRPENSSFFPSQ